MDALFRLIQKYRDVGLLIDTNVLLLLCIGLTDLKLIGSHKKLNQFTTEDFHLLVAFTNQFSRITTTPNILTEVSNLAGLHGGPDRDRIFEFLAQYVTTLDEQYVGAASTVSVAAFTRLGLTDVGIGQAAQDRYLVLTADLILISHLTSLGIDCINFNHLKPL